MQRDLRSLSDQVFDVLIVGGGIYGATTAWDASLRGLSVALVERGDLGSGTTSNSLKTVHGGLRYLQQMDLKRVRESVRERSILLDIAPHLVHPLPCVMPTYGHFMKGKEVMRVGLLLNDILSLDRNRSNDPQKTIPGGRVISKQECLRLIPGIDGHRVTGGVLWTDAQMYNSERTALSFVSSAAKRGAVVANYVEATGLMKKAGKVGGVNAIDSFSGDPLEIRAKTVVNACGGWADKFLQNSGLQSGRTKLSTALNLVVKRQILPECAAGVYGRFEYMKPDGGSYRGTHVLFMAPWRKFTIVGTYHRPYEEEDVFLRVTEKEIADFLEEINSAYPGDPIQREDVSLVHKGFLPMEGLNPKTGEVMLTKHYRLQNHASEDGLNGLISIVSVKYTTARDVAEKTVNMVFRHLGSKPPKHTSRETPLDGGEIEKFDDFLAEALKNSANGLGEDVMRHLVYNYGSEYPRVLEYGNDSPDSMKLVPGSSEVIFAEVLHAVREEMAQKLSDVVLRRTDLGSGGHPGKAALDATAKTMAQKLDWTEARAKEEVDQVEAAYIPVSTYLGNQFFET